MRINVLAINGYFASVLAVATWYVYCEYGNNLFLAFFLLDLFIILVSFAAAVLKSRKAANKPFKDPATGLLRRSRVSKTEPMWCGEDLRGVGFGPQGVFRSILYPSLIINKPKYVNRKYPKIKWPKPKKSSTHSGRTLRLYKNEDLPSTTIEPIPGCVSERLLNSISNDKIVICLNEPKRITIKSINGEKTSLSEIYELLSELMGYRESWNYSSEIPIEKCSDVSFKVKKGWLIKYSDVELIEYSNPDEFILAHELESELDRKKKNGESIDNEMNVILGYTNAT